jgi:hypothetical protein
MEGPQNQRKQKKKTLQQSPPQAAQQEGQHPSLQSPEYQTPIWETSGKKNQTEILEIKSSFSQIKNTVDRHSSRLEQVENRISKLKD